MQWMDKLSPGVVINQPVISLDILPTVLAAAEIAIPTNLDGINLLPYLAPQKPMPERPLFWRIGKTMAVRVGDWKLLMEGKHKGDVPQLYHLESDISEAIDVAATNVEKVKQLTVIWDRWNATLPAAVRDLRTK